MKETELDKAKIYLLNLLLKKPAEEWTENEADLGFLLTREKAVQERYNKSLERKKRRKNVRSIEQGDFQD